MEESKTESTVEKKLRGLYDLQLIDSRIDTIRSIRGSLPLEIETLGNEVTKMETRLSDGKKTVETYDLDIKNHKRTIENAKVFIKKYSDQQKNVRNNREFNSISKEIEYQELEIQLAEKKINEVRELIEQKKEDIQSVQEVLDKKSEHLENKKSELGNITKQTEEEESKLREKSEEFRKYIDQKLLSAYDRLRRSIRNGLAVVPIDREASTGSFIVVPPQVRMEVASRNKIITDEYSGCILVDSLLAQEEQEKIAGIVG